MNINDQNWNLIKHLQRQKLFSETTFGPGIRTNGVLDHIQKEIEEVRKNPLDLEEWIDIILLAFDGAQRTGATPEEIVSMIDYKQNKNETRTWPDWKLYDLETAITHLK